jgi:hypothetical protein
VLWSSGMLPVQGTSHDDALHGLAHSEPGATKRRVERHDSVLTQPYHETGRVVSTESLSSTSSRRSGGMSSPILGAICKPSCHRCRLRMGVLWAEFWWCRQQSEDLGQFLLQPLMQDDIGTGGDALARTFPVAGWNKVSSLAVPFFAYSWGCLLGSPVWLPLGPRIGNGLIGTRFM